MGLSVPLKVPWDSGEASAQGSYLQRMRENMSWKTGLTVETSDIELERLK